MGLLGRLHLGGGFWGIKGDDGQDYRPINMPAHLKKEGKTVSLKIEEADEGFSIFMWGQSVKIV
jgi:hypothetical protein